MKENLFHQWTKTLLEKLTNCRHIQYYVLCAHAAVFTVMLAINAAPGYDTLFYEQYAENFLTRSAKSSYGPVFFAFFVPVYWLGTHLPASVALKLPAAFNMLIWIAIDWLVWRATQDIKPMLATAIGHPLLYSVLIINDQRNDILLALLICLAITLMSADREKYGMLAFGVAGGIKWVPFFMALPYLACSIAKENTTKSRTRKLSILAVCLIAPITMGTALLIGLGFTNVFSPYLEHWNREPVGSNPLGTLVNFEILGYDVEIIGIIIEAVTWALLLASIVAVCWFAFNDRTTRWEWTIAIALCFVLFAPVTNNQFSAWYFFPIVISKDTRSYLVALFLLSISMMNILVFDLLRSGLFLTWLYTLSALAIGIMVTKAYLLYVTMRKIAAFHKIT